jgi:hypothetical protein
MITFGDICGLAFLIAVPVIGIKLYKDHQNDVIGWANNAQRDKEIDDFTQFIISHESANQISVGEIKWYIGKYCETKSASFEEFNAEVEYRMQHPRVNILGDLSNHKRLLDKYKNTENFNEIEFFQELNETLKKEKPLERRRIESAINRGCYKQVDGQYICDFNNVVKLEVHDFGIYGGKHTYISLKDGEVVNAQGDEVIELFNKCKIKQEKNKQNLI